MARVLIVDDDPSIRESLREVLEDEGHDVDEAPDGLEGLARIRATTDPMVVLLDLLMPRLNGNEVLNAVAADPQLTSQHAYVLLTAQPRYVSPALKELLARLSIPVMGKPFDMDELCDTIAQAASRA